jgi:hypothetical protein
MINSILTSVKKNLGVDESYTAFDPDIVMYINGVFSTLEQLGVGPVGGFSIDDDSAKWEDFIGLDPRMNSVKTYVTMRVRLLFDPPTTSFLQQSLQEQCRELEWRLEAARAVPVPLPQIPIVFPQTEIVLDGGDSDGW